MHQKQQGIFFIEILISLLLLSIAILGLDCMQMQSLTAIKNYYWSTIAIQQIENFSERSKLSSVNLQQLFSEWNEMNAKLLPNGFGTFSGDQNHFMLTLRWGSEIKNCYHIQIGSSGCLILKR